MVDPTFSFGESILRSVEAEWYAPITELGPTDSMSEEERERAYDAFFGTTPLGTPNSSPNSSRSGMPLPIPPPTKTFEKQKQDHARLSNSTLPSDVAATSSSRKRRRDKQPANALPAMMPLSQPTAPQDHAAISSSRKRRRIRQPAVPPQPTVPQAHAPLAATPPSHALGAGPSQEGGPKNGNSKDRRNKAKSDVRRTIERKKLRAADPNAGRAPRKFVLAKHVVHAETTKTEFDAADIPSASTGFVALPDTRGAVHTLHELIEVRKFTLVKWDGR